MSSVLRACRPLVIVVAVIGALYLGLHIGADAVLRHADDATRDLAEYPTRLGYWKSSVPATVAHFPATIPAHATGACFFSNAGPLQASANLYLLYYLPVAEAKAEIARLRPHAIPTPQVLWIDEHAVLYYFGLSSSSSWLANAPNPNHVVLYISDDGHGAQSLFVADPTTGMVCYAATIE